MKQVVFDTRVLVRCLIDPAEPYSQLFPLPEGWKLSLSDLIVREVLDILLNSASLSAELPGLKDISLAEAYQLVSGGEVYPVPGDIEIEICKDPDDNKSLASALAADCDYLVTEIPDLIELEGNPDWQQFKSANSVRVEVMNPARFLTLVGQGAH